MATVTFIRNHADQVELLHEGTILTFDPASLLIGVMAVASYCPGIDIPSLAADLGVPDRTRTVASGATEEEARWTVHVETVAE